MRPVRDLVPSMSHVLTFAAATALGVAIAGAQNADQQPPAKTPPAAPKASPKDAVPKAAPNQNVPADRAQPASPARPGAAVQPSAPAQPGARQPTDAARDAVPRTANRVPGGAQPKQQRRMGIGGQFAVQGDQGLRVTTVDPNGALSQAGFRQNDRIISVEGRTFNNPVQFQAFLFAQGGRPVPVVIERDGQQYTLNFFAPPQEAEGAWLGVYLAEGDANTKGARITQVYPTGPASRAGLFPGDIITQINKQPIEGSADVIMMVQDLKPQSPAELAILRGKQAMKVPVILGSRGSYMYRIFEQQDAPSQQPFYGQQQFQGQQPFQGQQQAFYGQQPFRGQQQTQQPPNQQFQNGNGQKQDDDGFDDIAPFAMQLEHDRRNAEQHERIEEEIRLLREEIRKLREQLERK